MNKHPEQTTADPDEDPKLVEVVKHLDALLGVEARKPGSAAQLPAVIRITETLEAAGGKEFPVFPPSYAGDGTGAGPVYDLNGIEYGEILQEKSWKDTKRNKRAIIRARQCTMDSPQSHANRTEIAFRDDPMLRSLVPEAYSVIPRKEEFKDQSRTDVLALPHRVADFRIRASNKASDAKAAISALARGDALPLLQLMPTSIVFGFWDSRAEGYQHKHTRILLTRIDAFNVVPCERHSLYTGPYSKDECAAIVLDDAGLAEKLAYEEAQGGVKDTEDEKAKAKDEAKKWADAMSARGFSSAPGSGLGGVLAEEIKRLALISLTDIASIFCKEPIPPVEGTAVEDGANAIAPGTGHPVDQPLTNAARRYLLALALLAENFPRSMGSYRLRSGCELLPGEKKVELLGGGVTTADAQALAALCSDRELLIKVAESARKSLKIKAALGDFHSDAASLKADLSEGNKSAKSAKKQKVAAEKAAKELSDKAAKARKKASDAQEAAKVAAQKAEESGKDKDRLAADKKAKAAQEFVLAADKLEKAANEAVGTATEEFSESVPADDSPDAANPDRVADDSEDA